MFIKLDAYHLPGVPHFPSLLPLKAPRRRPSLNSFPTTSSSNGGGRSVPDKYRLLFFSVAFYIYIFHEFTPRSSPPHLTHSQHPLARPGSRRGWVHLHYIFRATHSLPPRVNTDTASNPPARKNVDQSWRCRIGAPANRNMIKVVLFDDDEEQGKLNHSWRWRDGEREKKRGIQE